MTSWKRLALVSAAFGAGFAICACVIAGSAYWYASRPKPPKPWNDKALVVVGPPGFGSYSDADYLYLTYSVRNDTKADWSIESSSNLLLVSRLSDGSLSNPVAERDIVVRTPYRTDRLAIHYSFALSHNV